MVDLVEQLREVKERDFSPESLKTMVLWGADEIERLRKIEEMARYVLEKFQKDEAQGYHTKDREFAISLLAKGFEQARS